MSSPFSHDGYDVLVAGARVAGASTARLLARAGLRVLVVDPAAPGRDTLSTHALMRAGVMQLDRWGLLPALREAGTPRIERTVFHYGSEAVPVAIEPEGNVDGLYAPRRTVLDRILAEAAVDAGAEIVRGWSVVELTGTPNGHVYGATLGGPGGERREIRADVVVGADGLNSSVARLVGARVIRAVPHATATVYGYFGNLDRHSYHWHFDHGHAAGVIPTNDDQSCVFVSMPPSELLEGRARGLERIFLDTVGTVEPALFELLSRAEPSRMRGFAGSPSVMREAAGGGWTLVGDAGYFKDPLTAHGMTDALRDAEILSRAITEGLGGASTLDDALAGYQATRDALSRELFEATSRIASLGWTREEVQRLHRELAHSMKSEVEMIRDWSLLRSAA